MLEYNEITVRKYIVFEGEPYEVLSSHVFRKQMRKPVNATKLKNLISGRVHIGTLPFLYRSQLLQLCPEHQKSVQLLVQR